MTDKSAAPQQTQQALVRGATVPTVYAEGLTQIMIGFPNSRFMLHGLVEGKENNPNGMEVRHMACEIIMPTAAMIEMAQNIINSIAVNKEMFSSLKADWSAKLDSITESVQAIDMPAGRQSNTNS